MKFSEAFDRAFELENEKSKLNGVKFAVTPATAKTLAFMWNILATADFVLDDYAYIDKYNNIISVSRKTSEKSEKKAYEKINRSVNAKETKETK